MTTVYPRDPRCTCPYPNAFGQYPTHFLNTCPIHAASIYLGMPVGNVAAAAPAMGNVWIGTIGGPDWKPPANWVLTNACAGALGPQVTLFPQRVTAGSSTS